MRLEATKGFLLNHLIHELLPEKGDGLRWSKFRSDHRAGGMVRSARKD